MPDAERGRGNETDSAMMNSGKRRIRKDEEEPRETRLALEGRGRRKSTEREETSPAAAAHSSNTQQGALVSFQFVHVFLFHTITSVTVNAFNSASPVYAHTTRRLLPAQQLIIGTPYTLPAAVPPPLPHKKDLCHHTLYRRVYPAPHKLA